MSGVCPECGAPAPWNAVPGKPYACPGCKNPVLPVERAKPPPPPPPMPAGREAEPESPDPPPPEPAPAPPQRSERKPWHVALLAFCVLGAAYVGVYRLLTAEARHEIDQLLALPDGDTLWTAEPPTVVPSGQDPAAIGKWKRATERWADRQKLEQRSKQVDALFTGLIGAFVVQTALTAVILVRIAHRSPPPPPRGRGAGRGAREPGS